LAQHKYSGSKFPITPPSICRCGWRKPIAVLRATPVSSTLYFVVWRRTA
jgi:hypothetical protein